jgi:hypothetical protein
MEKLTADMHELTDVCEFIKIVEYYKNGLKPDNPEDYFYDSYYEFKRK